MTFKVTLEYATCFLPLPRIPNSCESPVSLRPNSTTSPVMVKSAPFSVCCLPLNRASCAISSMFSRSMTLKRPGLLQMADQDRLRLATQAINTVGETTRASRSSGCRTSQPRWCSWRPDRRGSAATGFSVCTASCDSVAQPVMIGLRSQSQRRTSILRPKIRFLLTRCLPGC